jgi:hypothetical protein
MNYDAEFCQQFRVSEDTKRQCLALVSEILFLATKARNYGLLSLGKEAEESDCLILEGVMGILEGAHPKLLREILLSFLGESGHSLYKEEFEAREREKLESYLKKIEEQPAASNSSAKLGRVIAKLNGEAIKQFLQVINIDDLAKAIKGMDGKVQIKLFNHLPERGASLLLESVEQIDSIERHETLEAQNKVVAIISGLKDQGQIG